MYITGSAASVPLFMAVCVGIHIYMYGYVCILICRYVCMHVCMYIGMYVCIFIDNMLCCAWWLVYVWIYMDMYVNI